MNITFVQKTPQEWVIWDTTDGHKTIGTITWGVYFTVQIGDIELIAANLLTAQYAVIGYLFNASRC